MSTILEWILESHPGPEPRVLIQDVRKLLLAAVKPTSDAGGESVALIAARAGVSTRTVYRILNPEPGKETISLKQADALCVAADGHLSHCRLMWPDGTITPYTALSSDDG